jgi:hypothetical protein
MTLNFTMVLAKQQHSWNVEAGVEILIDGLQK